MCHMHKPGRGQGGYRPIRYATAPSPPARMLIEVSREASPQGGNSPGRPRARQEVARERLSRPDVGS
jgi:hypothetical protein